MLVGLNYRSGFDPQSSHNSENRGYSLWLDECVLSDGNHVTVRSNHSGRQLNVANGSLIEVRYNREKREIRFLVDNIEVDEFYSDVTPSEALRPSVEMKEESSALVVIK